MLSSDQNVVAEHGANPRMLIVHEVMGRNCGWLTAHSRQGHHGIPWHFDGWQPGGNLGQRHMKLAQPRHRLGKMSQEAGEPQHNRNQCQPKGKPKDGGWLGGEKEEAGAY